VSALGGTTALLLLCVFTVVNVAVLVLRKETVEHRHFRAPTWAPVLGAVLCVYLVLPGLSGKSARDYFIGLGLIALGVVLWGVNWLVLRARGEEGVMKEFDPQALKD
jgi:amino acid transporter